MFNRRLKICFLGFWLFLIAGVTIAIFWYNEYRYTLPTQVPSNYRAVKNGVQISLGDRIPYIGNKPLLLHFFNPACPCSRFNIAHVKALAETYSGKVSFAIVVVGNRTFDAENIREKFALNIPVIAD
ncbi:MAG: AhpC/TSA family protein, partial [Mucilaginibacter polytrichastri]|nr:AhpC/TSA family protein [Mucilaginibacter polytrichastri]